MKAILLLLLFSTLLFAANERYDLVTVRITDPKQLITLEEMGALIHDMKDGIARIEIPYKDFNKFKNRGFDIIEVLFPDISSYYAENEQAYHTYEGFRDSLYILAQNFPDIAKVETLGFSIQNRIVLGIKITENAQVRKARPRSLFEGCTHGNEKIAAEVAFALARHLILNYGVDPIITNLVNTRETWVVPLVNPDGYVASTRANANGVDCNRDYGYMWNGAGGSPAPFSQIETQNFRNFSVNHQLVHWCSYHSGTEFVSYPWSYTPQVVHDKAAIDTIARNCHNFTGYPYGQGYQGMYEIHGPSKDFAYGVFGATSWSLEVSQSYIPPASAIDSICDLNRPAQLYIITQMGYGIHGFVTDSLTGEPLKAMVSVQPMDVPVYTDSLGDYHRFVLPGTYSMNVWANGYHAKTITDITVPADTYVIVDVELIPDTLAPIAGFQVTTANDRDNDVTTSITPWTLGLHDGQRFSIGVNGWIVIDMGTEIINGAGYDFTVYENDADPEGYQVYASNEWNGPFTLIGADTGTASFDLSSGGIGIARYIKIQDDGDGSQSNPTAGFDLDAIEAATIEAPALVLTDMVIIDSLGNNNGRFDPDETVELKLILHNFGTLPALFTTGILTEDDPYVEILDSIVIFGDIMPETTIVNDTDLFVLTSSPGTPQEHVAQFKLYFTDTLGYVDSTQFSIIIGEMVATDPIPDGPRTPPLYWAYDNVDTTYSPYPVYQWVEINTIGTRLTLSDDQTVQITFPPAFGQWKYYGQNYTQVSICSNGWVAPGYQTRSSYSNRRIPDPYSSNPNGMICANWDDLYPINTGPGGVYYYHDEANHRFIIEYDSIPYYNPRTVMDKYQIIIYDSTMAAQDGNNQIIVQYMTANYWSSSTVGIEDPTNQIGICALFNDSLHRGCAPWTGNKAIKYTTDTTAISGIVTKGNITQIFTDLNIFPNPSRNQIKISYSIAKPSRVRLNIYDRSGRMVRTLSDNRLEPGTYSVNWNGKDNNGRKVGHGVYFLRLETDQVTKTIKTIHLR
jgi:hypothetical protein